MKRLIFIIAMILMAISAKSQIFYRITDPGSGNISYIFGTHHLAPLSTLDSIPEISKALEGAETVVGEVDMSGGMMQMAFAMQKYVAAPADSTLKELIPAEKFGPASQRFSELTRGMTLDILSPMKPMVAEAFLTMTLMKQKMPEYKEDEQLDSYFQEQARTFGKDVIALETIDEQAQYLYNTMPLENQARQLLETLENPEENFTQIEIINEAYKRHDLQTLLKLTMENEGDENSQQFLEVLLNKRNANWLSKLPMILKSGPTFIAVGAMHLPGDKGLIEGLRQSGFLVEAIK
ncbi:MAG: TraB/GumN family protein [Muribaculaceae bacterium]|nr:TraB/GumN family protein [Muribaculaceae bacterium]